MAFYFIAQYLIIATRAQERNDKVTTKTIEQIILRGDSKGEKLLKFTGGVVGETTRYR